MQGLGCVTQDVCRCAYLAKQRVLNRLARSAQRLGQFLLPQPSVDDEFAG
jgi:hypothetical protein